MPYLIRGSFKNIFAAFGRDFFSSDGSNIEDLRRDLERSPLLGTPDQCKTHIETWMDPELSDHEHYSQGNMFGEILKMLLGADVYTHPLKLANEQPEEAAKNIGKLDFGFIDHAGQLAAFHLEYRKDKPGQWLAGIIKNTNKIPEEREVIFISSFKPKVVDSKQGIEVVNVESGPIPLIGTKDKPLVHNPLVRNLVQSIIQKNGEVHPDSSIANQFTQIVSEKAYQPNERLLASLHKNVGKALANPGLKILEQLDLDTYKVPHLEKCLNQSKPFFQHLLALGKLKDKALARDKGILLLFLDSLNLLETYSQHKNAVWLPALADYIKRDLLGSSSQDVLLNISHVSRLWSMLSKSLSDNSKATIIDAFLRSSKSLGIEKSLLNIQNEDEAKVILNRIRNGESELQLFLDEMHRYEHLAGVLVNLSSSVSIQEFRKIATTPAIHEAYFLLQKTYYIT